MQVGKDHCKVDATSKACVVDDITSKSTQKETVRNFVKHFLETSSIVALMLLLNNIGRNHNSEKSAESCSMIDNSIAIQSLEI